MTEPAADNTRTEASRPSAATAGRMLGGALASGRRGASAARRLIRKSPRADRMYRAAVGVTGGTTVALGIVLMPLPGPGTLIALGGLSMLGTEFETARKVNARAVRVARSAAVKVAEHRARRAERRADDS